MSILKSLENRRSYYQIGDNLTVDKKDIENIIKKATQLAPDAFDMKSARVVVVFDKEHKDLWEEIGRAFEGKMSTEKLKSFKDGAGTILYFYDTEVVDELAEKFPAYADNFPVWANHANAMLQISIWAALRDVEVGASLQHYNPIIDDMVKDRYNLPSSYKLIAQMPFGNIVAYPDEKQKEDISKRVIII